MKKISITFLLLAAGSFFKAQTAFQEGAHYFSAGYGFPNIYKNLLKNQVENQENFSSFFATDRGTYDYKVTGSGPMFGKYEYGISELIGLGAVVGYYTAGVKETYSYYDETYNYQTGTYISTRYQDVTKIDVTSLSFGCRVNFHFLKREKLDLYAGFAAGYTKADFKISYESNNPSFNQSYHFTYNQPIPLYFGTTFGIRGYLTPGIAIFGEVGLDKWAVLQGGLTLKLN
jgi:hypothetical protein